MKYDVKRAHQGDKFYREGDVRDVDASTVKHLVKAGVLAEHDAAAAKAAQKTANKAEQTPANKAAQ